MGTSGEVYLFGTWRVEAAERRLLRDGVSIPLTPKVFETLLVLLENAGTLVSKETFMKRIWPDTCVEDLALVQNISQLRKALADDSLRPIETVSKRGYRFVLPVERNPGEEAGGTSLSSAANNGLSATAPPRLGMDLPAASLPTEAPAAMSYQSPAYRDENPKPKNATAPDAHQTAVPETRHRSSAYKRIVILGLAAALLASSWFGWLHYRATHGDRAAQSQPVMVPLLDLPGEQRMPALSPDGSRIAFVQQTNEDGKSGIYVEVVGTQSLLQLTTSSSDSEPVWSPDGRTIAFLRNSDEHFDIELVSALGGEVKRLYTGTPIPFASPTSLSFTKSGDKLAFADWDDAAQKSYIKTLTVSDLALVILTTPPDGYHDCAPQFSPDGSLVAFVRSTGPMFVDDVYVVSSSGGTPTRVTSDKRRIFSTPIWIEGGRELLISSTHAGMKSLWSVPIDGSGFTAVPGSGPGTDHPTYSAVTHELAYEYTVEDENVWRVALNPSGKAESPAQALFSSRTSNLMPQLSPDGKRLLFESDRSGYEEIWISNSDGSNPVQVTKLERYAGSPTWSPDGKSIAFDFRSSLHSGIYTLDLDSGAKPRAIAQFADGDSVVPSWSANGQWIYFASNHGRTGFHAWKVRADGQSEPVQVTQGEGFRTLDAEDGQSVYYTRLADPRLRKRAANTDQETIVEGLPAPDRWANWTIANHGIYFIQSQHGAPSQLKFVDAATKRTTTLFSLSKPAFYGLSVARDGKFVVYSQVDRNEHDIVLLRNFR